VTSPTAAAHTQNAARSAHDTASFIITTQADRGMLADAIQRHHEGHAAWLLSEATTPDGRAFARAYAEAAATLVADLREQDRRAAPAAATLPDGTPHADPFLAERGWQAQGGLYVRRPPADPAPSPHLTSIDKPARTLRTGRN
jgi:hypothetical protein